MHEVIHLNKWPYNLQSSRIIGHKIFEFNVRLAKFVRSFNLAYIKCWDIWNDFLYYDFSFYEI